jgi:CBS domain-containing protein
MRVEEVMSHRAMVIDADGTLREAAERMRVAVVGALPVLSNGRLVGMVTDRDLALRGLCHGLDCRAHVREVMTRDPVTCLPGESVEEAAELMRSKAIRRLVVVDESLEPIGVLSVDDLALFPETCRLAARVLAHLPEGRGMELDGTLPAQ